MFNLRTSRVMTSLLLLGTLVTPGLTMPVWAGGAPSTVIPVERLTLRQIQQLPDSQVIESRGQRITIGELKRMREAEGRAAEASARAAKNEVEAKLRALQGKLAADKQTIDLQNAKAMADFGRLGQVAAMEQEAAQLFQRSKTASPAEQVQIEQRAALLLQQLQQVGR